MYSTVYNLINQYLRSFFLLYCNIILVGLPSNSRNVRGNLIDVTNKQDIDEIIKGYREGKSNNREK